MIPSATSPKSVVAGAALVLTAVLASSAVQAAPNGAANEPAAEASPCPPTPRADAQDPSDPTSPILGCLNAFNLRQQADRPSDLTQGRPTGPADGQREAQAVETYKKGQIKSWSQGTATNATVVMPGLQVSGGQ